MITKRIYRFSVLVLLGSVLATGCGKSLKKITIEMGGKKFLVEVADTPGLRTRGLMYRKSLAEENGMLFVFEEPKQLSFWMKNTYIPLSIAFIAKDGTIKEIHTMHPLSRDSVKSRSFALYALEMNQGLFSKYGIKAGDKVVFPKDF